MINIYIYIYINYISFYSYNIITNFLLYTNLLKLKLDVI